MQSQMRVRGGASARGAAPSLPRKVFVRATAEAEASTSDQAASGDVYKVTLPKPLGVRFGRGNDGAAYVVAADANIGNVDDRITEGDKVVRISASFGDDIWDAKNFGQVMYAMKTRNGDVYLELLPRGGDLSIFKQEEMTEAERQFRNERAGGNYGAGTKELQARNYIAMKENERKRKEMFNDALDDFRAGKLEDALQQFEEVKGMEPDNYLGDNFARVSRIYIVTLYNIACCYSSLKQGDAAIEAMEEAMKCGFEDYKKVKTDNNLEYMRQMPEWETTLKKYDEPFLNEDAINAVKNLFSFGKKQQGRK